MVDIASLIKNPKVNIIKKYMADILQSKYPKNAEFIERLALLLVTDKDTQEFGNLIGSVYQAAYEKCTADHKKELDKHGIKVTIRKEEPNH